MNQKLVDSVIREILYDAPGVQTQQSGFASTPGGLTFGRIFPEAYSRLENGAEPCAMQTQCLLQGLSSARLRVTVRFLHAMWRDIGRTELTMERMPAAECPDFFHIVPGLDVDGVTHSGWPEPVERVIKVPAWSLEELCAERRVLAFTMPTYRSLAPISDRQGRIAGVILRLQEQLEGVIELEAEHVDGNVYRITARILNCTQVPEVALDDSEEIAMRTLASAHMILHAAEASFFSLIDPPAQYEAEAARCHNVGAWPVLVGDETQHETSTMLSSPIILSDYPTPQAEQPTEVEVTTLTLPETEPTPAVMRPKPRDIGVAARP